MMKCGVAITGMLMCAASMAAATVTGKVVDDRNRSVVGATIWIHIRPDAKSRPKPFSAWIRTGSDGGFLIANVPAGQFVICAQLPNGLYVDGCMWEDPRLFSVTDSAKFDLGSLRLREGHQFRVKIDDPRGELEAARTARRSTDVQLGVWTRIGFYPLDLKHQESNGAEYGAVVPYDTPLQLTVKSRKLRLADERGASIDRQKGFRQVVNIKAGKQTPMVRLRVLGADQP